MNILQSLFKHTEQRSSTSPLFTAVANYRGTQEIGNLQLSACFRCIEIISDSVAVLPIESVEKNLFENIVNMTKFQWLKLIVRNIIIHGDAFSYIITDDRGNPSKLMYIKPQDVVINYNPIDNALSYTVCNHQGISTVYPERMLHFRKITNDGVQGISLLHYAQKALNLAKLTEESAAEYFDTSTFTGVLTTDVQLTPEAQKQIVENFQYFQQSKSTAVLSGGVKYQTIPKDNAKDAELVEARQYGVDEICRFFGVPQALLKGQTTGKLEESQAELLTRTLQSYIVLIEEELSKKLLTTVNLDENALLRMSKNDQADYLTKLLNGGVITVNEARANIGYQPVEGGDKNIIAYTSVEDNRIN